MLSKQDKQYIDEKFGQVDKRFGVVDKKSNQTDQRFDEVNKRFDDSEDKIDRRFGTFIEHMNDQFAKFIEAVEIIVETRTKDIPLIIQKLDKMNGRVSAAETDIVSHEKRITKLESA